MRLLTGTLFLAGSLAAASIPTTHIQGNYVEARTADVYTGACFANSEVELVGNLAVFGWKINKGTYQGVNLDGLSVVGVVKAKSTLGDRFGSAYPVKSVLIVDSKADVEQQLALRGFAQRMAGDLLQDIVRVETQPIDFEIEGSIHNTKAKLSAGTLAAIQTRAIGNGDHICANEIAWYDPLTKVDHAMPAVATAHNFRGEGLDTTWSSPDKRSAFVGTFHLDE
jgi:hypothetical protein